MDDFEPCDLSDEVMAIIVSSTYGNGDPPGNAEALMEWLSEPSSSVAGVAFAVCALGDQTYPNFCQAGADFDRLMEERGGRRVVARKDCDEYFEEPFAEFSEDVVSWLRAEGEAVLSGAPSVATAANETTTASESTKTKELGTRGAPVSATLRSRRRLNRAGSAKETMHYEFVWSEGEVAFAPGDSFAVTPQNNVAEVDAILAELRLDGASQVTTGDETTTLREALIHLYDLQTVTPDLLTSLGGPNPNSASLGIEDYLEKRHLLDVVRDCPASSVDAQRLVDGLRSLKPRLYSVANSPLVESNAVHFTAETLRYSQFGRSCEGVATTWLADRVADGDVVPMYCVQAAHFRLPENTGAPVIMIGPGTGVAPYRAFLQHRQAQGASGRNWLFFGHQHRATDFLYEEEMLGFQRSGLLTKLSLAWSRDQDEKVYVQDRLLESGGEVWSWLASGAYVYVCGDKNAMAPQVRDAFLEILTAHGRLGPAQARETLDEWERSGRYCVDAY
jgi:sulfite reductase (NADPH) flavoprotein alpha-component